ncbi:lasso peptide biosynthesis B2 protein [Niallia taxi]|uniref:lasso peptide biosynthesis B2 protein n=1 Tax=Niallia taxi TaxID=2499688 RepID=UPI001243F07D|nr:lasso peptide biosynthesis B2 protein [Niallia taxi]MCM3213476.1 lasso peptide biosynthesis B2 protein [Niallia taxi]MED4036158.1 lasso peptide biosynthesis B2 protein [Niallia taxi]
MLEVFSKIKKFMRLDMQRRTLLIEAFFYLGRARYLKLLPFEKIAPSLGEQSTETSINSSIHNQMITDVSYAVITASKHTFWDSSCLVQAIAATRMLNKRKIESTLYMGIARDEDGSMIAHAWVRSGSLYVTGAETMNKFTVVKTFAKGPVYKKGFSSNQENHRKMGN